MAVLSHSGSGVLVLTTTEVDKTGASYYGEQGLHYLSAKGEGNIVLLGMFHLHLHACLYVTCTCSYVATIEYNLAGVWRIGSQYIIARGFWDEKKKQLVTYIYSVRVSYY